MKVKIFAVLTLTFIILGVFINTFILERKIDEIYNAAEAINIKEGEVEGALIEAKRVYDVFRNSETYISLTVSHDDLTNIESAFAEMIGFLEVEDTDGASVTKNRLLDALSHLGRLSGFNIDTII